MSVQMPSRMQLTRKYIDNKVLDQPQMHEFWFISGFETRIYFMDFK